MFRIALIIAALTSGHHHVTITHANGAGYMTTSIPCVQLHHRYRTRQTRIMCVANGLHVAGHVVVRTRFSFHATAPLNGFSIPVRRAYVYNAKGRLTGWVDWTSRARVVGHVLLRRGLDEVWQ